LALLAGGFAASCGGSSPHATPTTTQSTPAVLGSRSLTQLGPGLVDGNGNTLYVNTRQRENPAACDSTCQTVWPTLTGPGGRVSVSAGVSRTLVGSVPLAGGQSEITYNGYPLHTYAGDSTPGQANGEGVQNVWYVISPSGTLIRVSRTGNAP
jgi:predicted lipoprotein with Yx(FWY)xxD motif